MFNFEYEVEIEVDDEPEYEVEYEIEEDYHPGFSHSNQYDYGGFGGGNEVEIEIEYEQPHVDVQMYGGMHPNQMHHAPHQHVNQGASFTIQPNFNTNGWNTWGRSTPQNKQHWLTKWSGWYEQGNRQNMHFDNFQIDLQGSIWGHGSDGQGHFNISGKMNMNNKVFKFHKQYQGGVTVIYQGQAQGAFLAGQWSIPGNCQGKFQIKCNAPRWTGAFWQNGMQNNMHLDMQVDHFGVSGSGSDNVGCFLVRGQTQGNIVTFVKKYYGQHEVFYQGKWKGNNIQGVWQIPGNCSGKFQLHC